MINKSIILKKYWLGTFELYWIYTVLLQRNWENKVYSILIFPLIQFSPAIKMIASGPTAMLCSVWGFVRFIFSSFFSNTEVIILNQAPKGQWKKPQLNTAALFSEEAKGCVVVHELTSPSSSSSSEKHFSENNIQIWIPAESFSIFKSFCVFKGAYKIFFLQIH